MSLLRDQLDELDVYVTRIADATGIPPAHIEKDFWLTEVLRAVSLHFNTAGCSLVFKGGTSLSKAHKLIQRFSEDADVVVVLSETTTGEADRLLKSFVEAVEEAIGIAGTVEERSAEKGVKRSVAFGLPAQHLSGMREEGFCWSSAHVVAPFLRRACRWNR